MDKNRYLSAEEVADVLGITVNTLYRRRSDGMPMPAAIKFGRNLRWRESVVDAWMAEQEEKAA